MTINTIKAEQGILQMEKERKISAGDIMQVGVHTGTVVNLITDVQYATNLGMVHISVARRTMLGVGHQAVQDGDEMMMETMDQVMQKDGMKETIIIIQKIIITKRSQTIGEIIIIHQIITGAKHSIKFVITL